MTDPVHKFKIGQTVDLIPSVGRSAALGHYGSSVCVRPMVAARSIVSRAKMKATSAWFPRAISIYLASEPTLGFANNPFSTSSRWASK